MWGGGGGAGRISIYITASKSVSNEPRFTELVRSFTVVAVVEIEKFINLCLMDTIVRPRITRIQVS